MLSRSFLLAAVSALAMSALPGPAIAKTAQAAPGTTLTGPAKQVTAGQIALAEPAPLSQLLARVDIPHERFVLDNGLTVLVHEDRSAPLVAVSMWYAVGSKNEPEGKTGFAHLFEHLMFNGSENAPGDFFAPLQDAGATDFNGTTWFDRTNYFQTVPTGALDRALMLESDRMGHLLGAVTQEKLDNQIGVVQNEKRQGDNQPFGLVEYEALETLYPAGHPYHHSTIGSMEDLSSATLDDVKNWFRDHYGPNNAILVLAGDIDTATALQKVTAWFGAIPAGPQVAPVAVPVPTLPAPVAKTIYDRVATTRIYRMWATPGLDNPDFLPLALTASVLGGLSSSRLDNALVREEEIAVRVAASASTFAQGGQFTVFADVKPGVDPAVVGRALDREIAQIIAQGPTEDELLRARTRYVASEIRGLGNLGGFAGKAPTLAQGLLYQGNPDAYQQDLRRASALTTGEVQEVAQKWLSRPVFALTVEPGDRTEGGEQRGGYVTSSDAGLPGPAWFAEPGTANMSRTAVNDADRSSLPEIGTLQPLDFPEIQRATLSNGIKVYFARRTDIPTVAVRVSFDAGYAADPRDALGTQSLLLQLMDQGTTSFDANALAMAQERLGANISAFATLDETALQLDALVPNLAPSLELLADYIRRPALAARDLERVRAQQLNRIESELTSPEGLAQRAIFPLIYGPGHPYGIPPSGLGERAAVETVSRDDLARFHDRWLRPDLARILVVGDTTLAQLTPLLEQSFGSWQAPATPAPQKDFAGGVPVPRSRIVLIDRPDSPQSVIWAGRVLDRKGTDDLVPLGSANYVFGGNFLSRINMNLRETKGWSYGVRSMVQQPQDRASFMIYAPVQADQTGASLAELRKDLASFTTGEGVSDDELTALVNSNVRELPGSFETQGDVLGGLANIVRFGRPDDYYETLADRYRSLDRQQLDREAQAELRGDDLVFVVVGDADVVAPQLDALGLEVEVQDAPASSTTAQP
ncbi:pitrilysin family protein [Croceicoccus sp. F390]|uniref:Pitrilysin family protein n=1 Tax=Croceicoccus esteveae TaxID=3075597 RepID=A0ABU2ZGW2_9SPHN|nr:pitrilysin family protein [Croceicoccus sp. F390]MDT0574652.1 pitrilysin family protein [Croceicoccus sp. F390]